MALEEDQLRDPLSYLFLSALGFPFQRAKTRNGFRVECTRACHHRSGLVAPVYRPRRLQFDGGFLEVVPRAVVLAKSEEDLGPLGLR